MTTPEVALRAAIDAMPAYVPGARPAAGAAPLVKLSSNENPYPPHAAVVAAVHRAGAAVNRYPDMYAAELVEAIAARHGRPASGVVVGNGSVSVLSHVLDAVCEAGDEVVFPWRSFEAYPIAVATARATGVRVPLTVDGRHDLAAMSAAVTDRTRAVLLCSPNNPTGPALRSDELRAFLASVRGDVLVLLDEAYAEFVRDPDAADGPGFLAQWPNLVVLRTFSKAYGLAGLRVGYALAAERLAAGIRAVSTPFGVNGVAQEAALAALADLGQEVPDAQGNFLWLPLGERSAELAAHAREAGVLVRPFAGEGVRVSIGTPDENDAFLTAMRDWA